MLREYLLDGAKIALLIGVVLSLVGLVSMTFAGV